MRPVQAHSAMTRLAMLCKNKAIRFHKAQNLQIIRLRPVNTALQLYGCERWTLMVDMKCRIPTFENNS